MLSLLRGRRKYAEAARSLYETIIAQARNPVFYRRWAVPDTLDGRFDLIVLHAFLTMHRLGQERRGAALSQALFDLMFADMDSNLRELGVSDLAVGKRIKTMAKAFFGRIAAYEAELKDAEHLAQALHRNLYRGETVDPGILAAMAQYVRAEAAELDNHPLDELLAGKMSFGGLKQPAVSEAVP